MCEVLVMARNLRRIGLATVLTTALVVAVQAYLPGHLSNTNDGIIGVPTTSTALAAETKLAPDFTLKSTTGEKIRLTDVVKSHKATVLNLFATWCPPCQMETPEFVDFWEEYSAKGVELLSVSLGESRATVLEFVKEYKMSNPVLLDTDGTVGRLYKASAIPVTLILDGKGKIVKTFIGMTSGKALRDVVNKLIN